MLQHQLAVRPQAAPPGRTAGRRVARRGEGLWLGAIAGHAAGGMSRSDLKDLGETLDEGQSAVVAVAAAAIADRVAETLKGAEKVDRKELKADPKAVKADVAAAGDAT